MSRHAVSRGGCRGHPKEIHDVIETSGASAPREPGLETGRERDRGVTRPDGI